MEPFVIIMVLGVSVGWFLRSAAQWRRDAKRNRAPISPPPAVPVEPRVERLLERLNERMETLEDRIDFAERLLDARAPVRPNSVESQTRVIPPASARQ